MVSPSCWRASRDTGASKSKATRFFCARTHLKPFRNGMNSTITEILIKVPPKKGDLRSSASGGQSYIHQSAVQTSQEAMERSDSFTGEQTLKANTRPRKAKLPRSPGERAFDLCFYPFGVVLAFAFASLFGDLLMSDSTSRNAQNGRSLIAAVLDPTWYRLVQFAIGELLCVYWLWALWCVLRAWRDPGARVLRFSALFLLLFDGCMAFGLLTSPFSDFG